MAKKYYNRYNTSIRIDNNNKAIANQIRREYGSLSKWVNKEIKEWQKDKIR